jgi:hypothetical protein
LASTVVDLWLLHHMPALSLQCQPTTAVSVGGGSLLAVWMLGYVYASRLQASGNLW